MKLTNWSIRNPQVVFTLVALAVALALIAFVRVRVDTDPENMLPADDPVRVTNAEIDARFGSSQLVVAAVIAEDSVLTPERVAAIVAVHEQILRIRGVIPDETFSLSSFAVEPSYTALEVEQLGVAIAADPLFGGNVVSADGTAATWFIAIDDKDAAASVAADVDELIASTPALASLERHIAGLPLAQDAFGQQMFIQMAIFAPMAGALVFALMWFFFRKLALVIPAMMLAMATVILTMGSLIGSGNTLHIMSSMIPIFLMPIAILDSVHVLSEFFDRYPHTQDRDATVRAVMHDLIRPLTFTSLTTAVGFAALALTPIPPVQVFGIFVALGVFVAWLLTVTLLPALIVTTDPAKLAAIKPSRGSGLHRLGGLVVTRRRPLLGGFILLAVVAVPALTMIQVNDNPVRWFRDGHQVRVATERLNDVLPGTFGANLLLRSETIGTFDDGETRDAIDRLVAELRTHPQVGAVQTYTEADYPVLRDGDAANLRLQLRSGDNIVMQTVVDQAAAHLATYPIPGVTAEWAGETYLNLQWQNQMVRGMITGLLTTIAVVFVLLIALFQSLRWAVLAITPVLWTILIAYGLIGWSGKDFDMPIAVLSTLVLGIGVDFAIHFVERFRALQEKRGSSSAAIAEFFGEPSTALTRNAVVLAVGFTPLFLSSLVPYVVVGAFIAGIIALSWLATIVALPAMVARVEPDPEPGLDAEAADPVFVNVRETVKLQVPVHTF